MGGSGDTTPHSSAHLFRHAYGNRKAESYVKMIDSHITKKGPRTVPYKGDPEAMFRELVEASVEAPLSEQEKKDLIDKMLLHHPEGNSPKKRRQYEAALNALTPDPREMLNAEERRRLASFFGIVAPDQRSIGQKAEFDDPIYKKLNVYEDGVERSRIFLQKANENKFRLEEADVDFFFVKNCVTFSTVFSFLYLLDCFSFVL